MPSLFPFVDPSSKQRRGYKQPACSIDGVQFRINPTSYRALSERVHVDVPTKGGYVRYAYSAKPTVYTLEGFTGVDGAQGLDVMEHFRPLIGNQDRLVVFKYPDRFTSNKYVYVNSFEDSISSDMHLYNSYAIELVEYGQQTPTSVVKLAAGSAQSMGVFLLPGGGGTVVN